jgi:replicative DNA helicase
MGRLADGMPAYLRWAEEYLVGASMWADPDHIQLAAVFVNPEDFRDRSLGLIWAAVIDCLVPSVPNVMWLLDQRGQLDEAGGEDGIARLASSQGALMYCGLDAMEAHAQVVHEWADRRRAIHEAQETARAAYSGKVVSSPLYARPEYQEDI